MKVIQSLQLNCELIRQNDICIIDQNTQTAVNHNCN